MKQRLFDAVVATALLVITSPVLALIAIAVAVDSGRPILYRATRVGAGGSRITVHKFRTMSPSIGGPGITVGGDPRITRVGRILRRTKLDELPQLWDVARGAMSLVGPRPEDPRYLPWYTAEQQRLFDWRPGITSPASVTFRDEERRLQTLTDAGASLEEAYQAVLVDKVAIDLAYFPDRTVGSDIRWIARTVAAMLPRH